MKSKEFIDNLKVIIKEDNPCIASLNVNTNEVFVTSHFLHLDREIQQYVFLMLKFQSKPYGKLFSDAMALTAIKQIYPEKSNYFWLSGIYKIFDFMLKRTPKNTERLKHIVDLLKEHHL